MEDGPEREVLKPFAILKRAVASLDELVTVAWRAADRSALRHQAEHRLLARVAIMAGTTAIALAIVQLAVRLTRPDWSTGPAILEAVAVTAGTVAIGVGLTTKHDKKWLGQRHLAERLRMLKFQALCRPDLWSGKSEAWDSWVRNQIGLLKGADDYERINAWTLSGKAEIDDPAMVSDSVEPQSAHALAVYYRHKRLAYQASYFDRQSARYAREAGPLQHISVPLFLASVVMVLIHFGSDLLSERLGVGAESAVTSLKLIAGWSAALAAILPVISIGVRGWMNAFELPRSSSLYAAKGRALGIASVHLIHDQGDFAATLRHAARDEHFLENEHREWLRLLREAEWFF